MKTGAGSSSAFILPPSSFALWAVIALLWANLPYLTGYVSATPQNQFGGFFLYEQDGYSYYAKMRQGAQGAWVFHLPYTSEVNYQSGGFVYPYYLVLGKLAPHGLSYPLLYHGARLLSSILLLVVLARFIARFVPDQRWRVWTWWLLLFSGGWGLLISTFINPRYVPYELIAPDAFVFSILYGPPHIIFGFALFLIWIGYTLDTLKIAQTHLLRRIVIANVLGGLTALSREAYGPAFAGIFIAYWIALAIQRRKIPRREGVLVALSCVVAGAYSVYLIFAFQTSPGLAAWLQQNPFTSPDLLDFVLGFAPLLILALFGLFATPRTPRPLFLVAWLIAGPIMAYLPIAISRRLIVGWQIPLCVFAAYALLRLLDSKLPLRRVLTGAVLVALIAANFIVIVGGTMLVAVRRPPLFQPADQLAVLDWLSRNTTDRDVVLSDWRFGNLVPIYADARVFVGHPIETIGFSTKRAAADRYFAPATSDAERQALLTQWGITLVVSDADRSQLPTLTLLFQQGDYTIYRAIP